MLGGVMKASQEELDGPIFQDRITPFIAEGCSRLRVQIELAQQQYLLRKKTRKNGHFKEILSFPESQLSEFIGHDDFGNRIIKYRASINEQDDISASSSIFLLDEVGLSIVSDIDDTIKETCVGDRKLLLTNTFLKEFRSIDGMSSVYRQMAEAGASFHYVSSSPWQLFDSLLEMKTNDLFPPGTIHLRNFRLRDQVLRKVMLRRPGKAIAIRLLMELFPKRTFILIGDSSEKDPEIYGKICRKYPHRIHGLFIRDTPYRPLAEDRWEKMKRLLPPGRVGRFADSDGLRGLLDRVI